MVMNTAYLVFVPDVDYDIPDSCYYSIIRQHYTKDYTATSQLQELETLKIEVKNLFEMLKNGAILFGRQKINQQLTTISDFNSRMGVEIIIKYLKDAGYKYLYKSLVANEGSFPQNILIPISAKTIIEKFPVLFSDEVDKICKRIGGIKT